MNQSLLLVVLTSLMLVGCQTLNPLSAKSETKMQDITGSLGEEVRKSKGDIYVKMSAEYLRQGNITAALKNNKKALSADADNGQAHSLMAVIYQRLNQNELAEKHYKIALNLLSGDSYIHNGYAAFLCLNGRYDEADEQFSKALLNPLYRTPEVALTNAGDCARRQNNLSRAEMLLRKSLKYNKRLPKTLFLMSEIMLETKNTISARRYLKRFHNVSDESAQSLWLAIRIARGLGDTNAVAVFSAKMRSVYPDSEMTSQLGGGG